MFGVLPGALYVIVSTTSGSVISFVLSRHFFSRRISDYFLCHPRMQLLNRKFSGTGWRGVLLTRLIPFFPFKLSNYFFGLARFSLLDFALGTFFGIIPYTFFNVYVGSLAADLSTLGARHMERSANQWYLYGLGFFLTIVGLIFVNRAAQKALSQYNPDMQNERHDLTSAFDAASHPKTRK